jgi:NTE family protein
MGSIVGGLYAAGLTPQELETAITRIDWVDAFQDAPNREDLPFRQKQQDFSFMVKSAPGFRDGELVFPQGLIEGQKLNFILKSLTLPVIKINNFDKLPIPYRAIATDIETGEMVVIGSGDLSNAMRASMSVPGVFSPIRIDGKLLVDGGIVNNVPVDVARAMGADIVIAVDVGTPLLSGDKIKSVLEITEQLTNLMVYSNVKAQLDTLKPEDIFIQPALGDLGSADFVRSAEGIVIGEQAANKMQAELRHLSLPATEYQTYLKKRQQRRVHEPITVDFIEIVNNARLSDEIIQSRIRAKVGEELDLATLQEDFSKIYGLDIFERVDDAVVTKASETGLRVESARKSWGPNYLQFGIKLADNFAGENSYNIGVSYTMTDLNALNAEWRTEINFGETSRFFTEFYQPLDKSLRYFIAPSFKYENRNINFFNDGDLLAKYQVARTILGLEAGRELGLWGEFRVGLRQSIGETNLYVGHSPVGEFSFNEGDVFARFSFDKLDNINFPKYGTKMSIEWSSLREELGADASVNKLSFQSASAHTWDKNTVILGLGGVTVSNDDEMPIQYRSPLGGFLRLSGLHENELNGNHLFIGQAVYYRKIGDSSSFPTYLGFSLEAGNVWDDKDDVDFNSLIPASSAFFGLDSLLGPLYLGFGYAEGGRRSLYLYLGKAF